MDQQHSLTIMTQAQNEQLARPHVDSKGQENHKEFISCENTAENIESTQKEILKLDENGNMTINISSKCKWMVLPIASFIFYYLNQPIMKLIIDTKMRIYLTYVHLRITLMFMVVFSFLLFTTVCSYYIFVAFIVIFRRQSFDIKPIEKHREGEICLICLQGEDLGSTSCGHIFHKECLSSWIDYRWGTGCCPYCRVNILQSE
jgi:hypothetical protein